MRTKTITHITSFSTTGEMYEAIKRVSHELRISSSDLIREAIALYFNNRSLNSESGNEGKEYLDNSKQAKTGEVSKDDNVRTV